MELCIYTFVENTPDPETGITLSPAERMRDLLEQIDLADQVGLDVLGIGEHHRPDYVVSSPATVLAAAAQRTKRIRLTSAVTVLSSDDPVRVFQDFATLDLLSDGRAEIMAGRGSFIESFPLFGLHLGREIVVVGMRGGSGGWPRMYGEGTACVRVVTRDRADNW